MIKIKTQKEIGKYFAYALPFFVFPIILQAQNLTLLGTDIRCSGADCGFDNLLLLVQGLLSFLITLAIPVAAGLFVYAGFLYVTAVDNSSKVSQAKSIFQTVFWGFVIMLGAWVIVYSLVNAIVDPRYHTSFFRFLRI